MSRTTDRDEVYTGESVPHFLKNPFEGDKKLWRKFNDEVKTAVHNACGDEGDRFLFTDWPVDEDGEILVGNEFTLLPLPHMDGMHYMNPEERREWREDRKLIKEFNDNIRNIERNCCSILSKRCGQYINLKFNELGGDPVAMWKWLKLTYGPDNMGSQEIGNVFMDLLGYKIGPNDRFSNYIIEIERLMQISGSSKNQVLGLLTNDLLFIPERLHSQITKSKMGNFDFEFMINQDNQQNSIGLNQFATSKVQSVKSRQKRDINDNHSQYDNYYKSVRKSDEKIIWYNCKNQGHTVAQCNLDACSYCERFHVGHKLNNCPKRNNIQSKRNANYGKDKTNHQGKKNNSNNNNKKIKTNLSKKRGIKRVKSEPSDYESECDV